MARKKKVKKFGEQKLEVKRKSKEEMQLKLVVLFMIIIILSIMFFYWLSIKLKRFEYAGLRFDKEKMGNLILYKASIPLKDALGHVASYLFVYFREDPRKLNNIEIDGTIKIKKDIALADDESINKCKDIILAGTTLAIFLGRIDANPFGATTNKTEQENLDSVYVECKEKNDYSVVIFKAGNESRIEENGDCYILEIKNCEIMNVTERFMLGLYAHSQGIELK